MDYVHAISVLNQHKQLVADAGRTTVFTKDRKAAVDRLNEHSSAVNAILHQVNLGGISGNTLAFHRQAERTIDCALNLLAERQSMAQVDERLGC